jgi:hypothetical protein
VRAGGTIVAIVGLALCVGFAFLGCGSLFSWNGRHVVETHSIAPGTPLVVPLNPEPGRRYTASIEVAFDTEEGVEPAAKMPVSARAVDKSGATIVETAGWVDPAEPPTMLHGFVAERLIGSFHVSSRAPIELHVDLGADRNGTARIAEARLVLYDDVTPPNIKRALGASAAGGVMFLVGIGLVFVSFFRGRKKRGLRPP